MLEERLNTFPQPGLGRRWTADEIDRLKDILNHHRLYVVADAIGSLEFDLVDAKMARCPSPAPGTPTKEGP